MSAMLNRELDELGKRLRLWSAQIRLWWGLSALLGVILLVGLLDVAFQSGATGRWISFSLILLLLGGLAALLADALRRRYTPDGLATVLERAFPELDNHLINYIQFSRDASSNPFKAAYVKSGAPHLSKLELDRLKNQRAHRRGLITASAAAVLLLLPVLFMGNQWTTALWRMVNPLSAATPVTLTQIVEIEPGDQYLPQGESVTLIARVQGQRGHSVRLDIDPDDARRTTYDLGALSSAELESFPHRVPRVNTRFRYRFRAGDAPPSDWHEVTPRPPPAFTSVNMVVQPPAYTALPEHSFDLHNEDSLQIPAGARIHLHAESTTPLETLTVSVPGADDSAMNPDPQRKRWSTAVTVNEAGSIRLRGFDPFKQEINESIQYDFTVDHPPVIEVLAPEGRAVLPPGESPRIEFRVRDDYGLSSVHLEQMPPDTTDEAERGEILETWAPGSRSSLEEVWRGAPGRRPTSLTFRIVAKDNTPDEPQVTRSAPIVFNVPSAERISDARGRMEEEAKETIQRVIDLQKENLDRSTALRQFADEANTGAWNENKERQSEIRRLTRNLLRHPLRPLGGRAEAVGRIYADEMVLAIEALGLVPEARTERRAARIREAIQLQSVILRQLQAAEVAADRAREERQLSRIAALLNALLDEQERIVEQTHQYVDTTAGVPQALAEAQDHVAEDMVDFERACEQDARSVRASDPDFAELLDKVIHESRERRIRDTMFLSAEHLEQGEPDAAHPLGRQAYQGLEHLRTMLDEIGTQREEEHYFAMQEALAQTRQTLDHMNELHSAVRDTLDTMRGQSDKDDQLFDLFPEEFMEIASMNKESLLTIPTDLHVFSDLNVGNELVEDVFTIYEEIVQQAGSEEWGEDDVAEWLFEKNEMLIEGMAEIEDRVDEIEKWLPDSPGRISTKTETIDLEEMPEDGIALPPLASEINSLISDLLESNEELEEAATDSATTIALPDGGEHEHFEDDEELPEGDDGQGDDAPSDGVHGVPADPELGWETEEGEYSSFAAKGDMGSERPDHKEQDGRSSVGRQGMASGETTAGAGTIAEGDDQIEERRTEDPTQSGHVQVDGEADTVATGGGKQASGKADDVGMSGGVRRMDSTEEGSAEGMEALMARHAEDIYAQASLQNVRVDSLKTAAHHLRQANDAIARGDIERLREHRESAAAELRRARAQLAEAPSGVMDSQVTPQIIQDAVQAGSDHAPSQYRSQVAEYYKLLNQTF